MSAVNAPFGFRPAYHPTGVHRAGAYKIASGYASSIFKGDPVVLVTGGTIERGAAAADLLGVFHGVEYVDATGKPTVSNMWLASTTLFAGSEMNAWVWDNPDTVFEVQGGGSFVQADVGAQADVVLAAGDSMTGMSKCTLGAVALAGVQGQFRIVDFSRDPGNAPGDAFTVVQVKLARHQYVANKVSI